MSENSTPEIPTGRPPSEDTEFYLAWGRESLKANLKFANEVLRQLVTLNASLLGGSIVFIEEALIGNLFRWLAIAGFLLALVFSFLGMMPYEGSVSLRKPDEIRMHKSRALAQKRFCLWTAGYLMAMAFGIVIAGMVLK